MSVLKKNPLSSERKQALSFDQYKYISPTDFKFRLFESIINNMEFLWGEADNIPSLAGEGKKVGVPHPYKKWHLGALRRRPCLINMGQDENLFIFYKP